MRVCMRIIFEGAQAIKRVPEDLIASSYDETPRSFLDDTSVYYVVSSSMLSMTRQDIIASDKLLLSLAAQFVNPTSKHFDVLVQIVEIYQRSYGCYPIQNLIGDGIDWYLPVWEAPPDSIETAILLPFLLHTFPSDLPHLLVHL